LPSNVLEPEVDKSRMSAPTGKAKSVATCAEGFPAMRLRRMILPESPEESMKTPFKFPPILFRSIRLPLLTSTNPTPKLLLGVVEEAERPAPFP